MGAFSFEGVCDVCGCGEQLEGFISFIANIVRYGLPI